MTHLLYLAQHSLRKARVFRDRTQPLDCMDDDELIARYRLPRTCIIELCDELRNELTRPTARSSALSVPTQVLTALRFFATGSMQRVTGDLHGISQASTSRCVNAVASALCRTAPRYIKFPADEASQRQTVGDFYKIAGFPNVVGCVDGTQIAITSPSINEHVYMCRKGYHSLNVQGICDARLQFINVVAKYPGSAHDSFIWRNCAVYHFMEQQEADPNANQRWILGDSAYPLSLFTMTPVTNATTAAELRYNKKHAQTRNTVERAFGLLKMRFRCLHKTGGCLQSPPQGCAKVISACTVLHNICIQNAVPAPTDEFEDDDSSQHPTETVVGDDHSVSLRNGARIRKNLIDRRFNY